MKKSSLDSVIQNLIPPSLILLLLVTIIELFYGAGKYSLLIDIFDIYVIIIFTIDLYYRRQECQSTIEFIKKNWLDIIATIPFNLIFWGLDNLILLRGLRGIKIIARYSRFLRLARYSRIFRLFRFVTRAPRFMRFRKHIKETKIRKVQPHEKEMKGVLSFRVILLITINSIMGTGIWFLTAAGAKHAGPASLVSWGVLSLISIYIAMCFSELVSMFPKAGGVYEFAKQTYGRFFSFVIGWTTSIAGSVTIAMLLLGALQYLIPLEYSYTYIPIAISLIILFNYVAFRGMQTSTVMLVTFSIITIATVTLIILPGFFNFNPENFTPFFVLPTMNILLSIFFIAETFFGWESAIFLSAETKDPTKMMPKALIYGTIIIALLAFFLSFTAMGVIPWQQYGESVAPLKDIGEVYFGAAGGIIFTLLVFISVIGAVACWVVTAPRLLMSIAEDKLFFVQFAKVHPKYKSPYISIIFQVIVISILVVVGAGNYETLLHMLIPLIILVYSSVLLGVVILRFKKPEIARPYKVAFGKIGPLFTVLFMFFLLYMFTKETHGSWDILRVSASLIMFGIPAYFAIELFYDPKYMEMRHSLRSFLVYHFHKLPLPKTVLSQIISLSSPYTDKTTLAVDQSPLGALTKWISDSKLSYKEINIISQSRYDASIIKNHFSHLKNIKFSKKINKLKNINTFVSFNALGYEKDIPAYIKSIYKIMTKKGKFIFYISHHILNMTPNALIVEDKVKMLTLFKENGLKASYLRKKHMFGEKIFIYGVKK